MQDVDRLYAHYRRAVRAERWDEEGKDAVWVGRAFDEVGDVGGDGYHEDDCVECLDGAVAGLYLALLTPDEEVELLCDIEVQWARWE